MIRAILGLTLISFLAPAAWAEPEWISVVGQLGRVRVVIEQGSTTDTYTVRAIDAATSTVAATITPDLSAGETEFWLLGLSPLAASYRVEIRRGGELIAVHGVTTQESLVGIFPPRMQPFLIPAFDDVATKAGLSGAQKKNFYSLLFLTITRAEALAARAEADEAERAVARKRREFEQ